MAEFWADYDRVVSRFRAVCKKEGSRPVKFAELDGYPVYAARLGRENAPSLLLTAGLHGNEPGGVLGLLHWLENEPSYWRRLSLTVFPCLNPFGFENNQRCSRTGCDLNRELDNRELPLVRGLRAFLSGDSYNAAIDLHEDFDWASFYLWEIASSPPFLGDAIVNAVKPRVGISHGEKPDGQITNRGVIRRQAERGKGCGIRPGPMSHYVFTHHFPRCALTTELPGCLELETRIAIERIFLNRTAEILFKQRLHEPAVSAQCEIEFKQDSAAETGR